MKLDNKRIVLTGGSSGIGLDLLRALAASNTVINLSRTPPPADDVQRARDFIQIDTDLMNETSVARAIEAIKQSCPNGIDGLINCAAVQFTPAFIDADFSHHQIASEIAVNLVSPIQLISGLLDSLLQRPESFIFNVNSGLGIVPKRKSAVYCATKAGLDNFTRGLRAQLSDSPVSVQQAFLPLVETPMTIGRGSGKLSSESVAGQIIAQIKSGKPDQDIGKVKVLRLINRISPALANHIMQKDRS